MIGVLWHYWQAKRLRFADRAALLAYQQKQMTRFKTRVLSQSPYFSPYLDQPLSKWPLMDKAIMMQNFDQMNTAGLKKETLLACARQSEASRDFSPRVGKYSVGLSSGTSGERGLFVVSPKEKQIWAGGMLAKMLPDGIMAGERVALFLRADNRLYHRVRTRFLSLQFFDLFASFSTQLPLLSQYAPSIIVAPAQVLVALAMAYEAREVRLSPKKVISVAEVLSPEDKAYLQRVFGEVGEVYQATEGFLAASCPHGNLHLNEAFVYFEKEWLDGTRFIPVITDFTRETQPIVRYRLNDVLVAGECACGNPEQVIARIEGREDDQLIIDGKIIFADVCHRAIANSLPLHSDYQLIQTGEHSMTLATDAPDVMPVIESLNALFIAQGVSAAVTWQLEPLVADFTHKKRRIIRRKK